MRGEGRRVSGLQGRGVADREVKVGLSYPPAVGDNVLQKQSC